MAVPQTVGSDIKTLLGEALADLGAGNADRGEAKLRDILAADPDNFDALNNLGAVACQRGRVEDGMGYLLRAVSANPAAPAGRNNLLAGCNALMESLAQTGRFDAAAALLDEASRLMPESGDCREWLATTLFNAAVLESRAGHHEGARQRYRRSLAIAPGNSHGIVNQVNTLATLRAVAEPEDFGVTRPERNGRHIVIACMPKSGSTFLSNALRAATGFGTAHMTFSYFQNEQELHLPFVLAALGQDTITQQHVRATEANIQVMQAFGLMPVVLVRNLADVTVSLLDFYESGAIINTFFYAGFESLPRERRIDLIIDMVMPWYLGFYASWALAEREGRLQPLWLTYEDMIADKPAALKRVGEHCGLGLSDNSIAAALDQVDGGRARTRLNKGVAGRGRETLSDGQLARLKALTAYYPDIDFSPVGL